MNIIIGSLALLLICSSAIFFISDQTSLMKDTIKLLQKNKEQSYFLEGLIYYGIAYLKKYGETFELPHTHKYIKPDQSVMAYINFNKLLDNQIEITVQLCDQNNTNHKNASMGAILKPAEKKFIIVSFF